MKYCGVIFLIVAAALLVWFGVETRSKVLSYLAPANKQMAAVFQETITPRDLKKDYRSGRLKVLLVPGHDREFIGATYQGAEEARLNIEMARALAEVLAADQKLEVITTRDLVTGDYTLEMEKYLTDNRQSIRRFKSSQQALMAELLDNGLVENKKNHNHAFVNQEISERLYGVNKWANDHDIDIAIHIHFNDYPRPKKEKPKYHGLAVYVPDEQYPNGRASEMVAKKVFSALNTVRPTSTNPFEVAGVVPDQELIAIGSNANLHGAAMLIEYGYIYEPEFQSVLGREKIFKAMAEKTYEGLKDYLD